MADSTPRVADGTDEQNQAVLTEELIQEHRERIFKLAEVMKREGIDGFLVAQKVDLYYFTGSMQLGYLFVERSGKAVFYVKRSRGRAARESAAEVSALPSLRRFREQLAADFPDVFRREVTPTLAIEYDTVPVQVFQRLQKAIPKAAWTDGSTLIRELRMVKSPYEIGKLRASARIAEDALQAALNRLEAGMTEIEWMSRFEYEIRRRGHMGLMRMRSFNQELVTGMVGSGWAAAKPTSFDGPAGGQGLGAAYPQSSGRKTIGRHEPLLVDIGCCVDGYVTDQTRTVVIGELEPELHNAYQTAARILLHTESKLRPGTVCEELYADALEIAEEAGLGDHFMGYAEDQVRFLGHGIGLEIDEWPVLAKGFSQPLQPGMVIAIEPKFTFPGRGVVGIENTYAVTEQGYEKLTLTEERIMVREAR